MSERNSVEKSVTGDKNEDENTQSKYVFECQRCGQCCELMNSVVLSLYDLERWNNDMTLPSLYPYLSLDILDNGSLQLSLKKPESEEENSGAGCPLYDTENKICNIYFSMPLFCSSYPLGFDGKSYFIKDSLCPGIGKGRMTRESLKSARENAKKDFEERVSTSMLLPLIQGLTLKFAMDQSRKEMEKLTPEQMEKLNEIFSQGNE